MTDPLVSIVMSTYNRGSLIRESIQSILDQTYTNWELIVVDDGSTDDTRQVVENVRDNRIRYVSLPHSGFLGKVKNAGIRLAKGDLIAFHDSDDLWRRDKLRFQISLLNQYPEANFVLSNGDQFGAFSTPTPDYKELFVGNLFLPVVEKAEFCFYCPSLIFKRSVIEKTGWLDENLPFMRELHFFLRMSQQFIGIFTNERLISIRKHEGNFSNTFLVNAHLYTLYMLEEFLTAGNLTQKQYNRLSAACYYKIGLHHLQRDARAALPYFMKYTRLMPLDYKGWIRVMESQFKGLLHKTAAAA